MTNLNMQYYILKEKYNSIIENEAIELFNDGVESGFAYHYPQKIINDLIKRFGKDVAHDIYIRYLEMVDENGYDIGGLQI